MESIKKSERNHETWLANYTGNSLLQYQNAWAFWKDYLGVKTEKWILKNRDVEDWSKHLVNFHRWLTKHPKQKGHGTLSDNTAKVMANGLRGYFRHLGIAVGLTKVQKEELSKVESQPQIDYPFNLQVKEQLLRIASPIEEYIVSVGVSFGLRTSDFQKITQSMIVPLLDAELPIQLPKFQTKKKGVPAYPLIDRDAKDAILRLLAEYYPNKSLKEIDAFLREENKKGKPSIRMLNYSRKQINTTFKNLFEKADVPVGEFNVRFHILRKFLTDNLANVCASDKWKTFVGKKTNTPYVGHEGIEAYKKVMSFTNVNGKRTKVSNKELEELKHVLSHMEKENQIQKTRINSLQETTKNHKDTIEQLKDVYLMKLDDMNHELGRTSALLEIMIENVLTTEQREKLKKISKEHFGDEYPV